MHNAINSGMDMNELLTTITFSSRVTIVFSPSAGFFVVFGLSGEVAMMTNTYTRWEKVWCFTTYIY